MDLGDAVARRPRMGMRHIADDQQTLHQRLETVVQQLEQVQREVDVLKAKEAK